MIDSAEIRALQDSLWRDAGVAAKVRDLGESRVLLFASGGRWRGECPLCGHGAKKKAAGPFWTKVDSNRWGCFACSKHKEVGSDGIGLASAIWGCSRLEAARDLAPDAARALDKALGREGGAARLSRAPVARAPAPDAPAAASSAGDIARNLWREALPAAGTLVERYLSARGIRGPVLRAALRRVRFHPKALWGKGDNGRWVHGPAMVVAVVVAAVGPLAPAAAARAVATGGVHCTYLLADGSGRDPALGKKMWGPQGCGGHPGGAWLIGPRLKDAPPGPLIIAEGIESALSAAALHVVDGGGPPRVFAALSLGRLQGGWAADRYGRVSIEAPAADPAAPACTWPLSGLGVDQVLLAVDRDMKPLEGAAGVRVRKRRGGSGRANLDGEARARICAALAAQHWRASLAGEGLEHIRVRAVAPGLGQDFNDELRAQTLGLAIRDQGDA